MHEAHSGCLSVYLGSTKMYNDLKQLYWWLGMERDISKFVSRCLVCHQVKAEHQVPSRLLQPSYDRFRIRFTVVYEEERCYLGCSYLLDKLAELYIFEIVRLYEVLVSIILDRDPRFTSRFWKKLQEALGTRLNFSTSFHPQIDGQSERVI
ncbi:integrase [Gossypium australe]|uniref:Integrase n=1 Tax=Gossypium australe TaxID=47621 RepID=A0A5B6WSF3_9ROSI|nr:integrase [Gossypium australe]